VLRPTQPSDCRSLDPRYRYRLPAIVRYSVAAQIEPVAESPGVGLNLHDHPVCLMAYLSDRDDTLVEAFNEANLALYAQGSGPLANVGTRPAASCARATGSPPRKYRSPACRRCSGRKGSCRVRRPV
jgi:hypothetical protein